MLEMGSCHSWHFFGLLLEHSDQGFITNKYFCTSVGRQAVLRLRVHTACSVPGSVVTPTLLTHLGALISSTPTSWVGVKVK